MNVSFNVHGPNAVKKPDDLIQWVRDVKPRWILQMDDDGLAGELQSASPSTNIIGRSTGDEKQRLLIPEQWLDLVAHNGAYGRWIYMQNERGAGPDETDWSYVRLVAGLKRGWKFVVYNCSTGTPGATEWPIADKVIRLASDNPDQIAIGLHEYGGGLMWSAMDGIPYLPAYPDAPKGNRWLVGRFKFLLDYCDKARIKYPRIVITEHGFDDVFGAFAHPPIVSTPPYLNPRGWRSLVNQWAAWYPGVAPDDVYAAHLLWADKNIYASTPVEAQLVFCYGNLGGNQPLDGENWYQDNVEGTSVPIRLKEASMSTQPPPQPADWQPRQLRTSDLVNVRSSPSINGAVIQQIDSAKLIGGYYQVMLNLNGDQTADGYTWRNIQIAGRSGFVASIYVSLIEPPAITPEVLGDIQAAGQHVSTAASELAAANAILSKYS